MSDFEWFDPALAVHVQDLSAAAQGAECPSEAFEQLLHTPAGPEPIGGRCASSWALERDTLEHHCARVPHSWDRRHQCACGMFEDNAR